jgi:excisionase family DNA binding protein
VKTSLARVPAPPRINRSTPVTDLPELLTVDEAAAAIECSRGLIYELVRRNELPHMRFGRVLRVKREGVRPTTS